MDYIKKRGYRKGLFAFLLMVLLAFIPSSRIKQDGIPVYRVVIDPGHGGFFHKDKARHGDKYDTISGKYLAFFAEGANYRNIYEHELVYSIAVRVIKKLSYCSEDGDFIKFKKILARFSGAKPGRIYIETMISRGPSLTDEQKQSESDPNAPYRLYDYPDSDGEMVRGRISKINAFKPHLVVSLHMAESAPPDYLGMNGIIIPPYNVLKAGFNKLKKGNAKRSGVPVIVNSWFQESKHYPKKYYYFKDVSRYFTGYGLTPRYKPDYNDFKGYKYNMVDWVYHDNKGWEAAAKEKKDDSCYSINYKTFCEEGRFREREKSVYEEYRRGASLTNYGGDNYYATYELIRYILYSLKLNGVEGKTKIPGKPFVSTWSVPLLVNAVCAYIELGYFDRKWDRDVLLHRQEEISDGIAAGIYSLLAGVDDLNGNFRYKPEGKCIDLEKYKVTYDKSYFDIVTDNHEENFFNFN